jgi:hypothetical protein
LRELANYVARLGSNDGRLLMLAALDQSGDDIYHPFEEAAQLTSRFRFHDPNEDSDGFFSRFTEAEERGLAEAIEEGII